jgi:molybdenum cofactor cytidylyltransferase
MMEGVVVAAGFSSRAEGWKMAFDIGGVTVIERVILGMSPYCSRLIVVGGYRFNLLQWLLPKEKYPWVKLIFNPNYEKGMFSSVLAGMRRIHAPRIFFIPGDYPLVSSHVYERLLEQEGQIIIPSFRGTTGHPVLFQSEVIEDLFRESNSYTSLRQFIASHQHTIVEVADPGIVMDIDTWEDYLKAIRYFQIGAVNTTGHSFNP